MIYKTSPETAFAVGIVSPKQLKHDAQESFDELKSLIVTAGADLLDSSLVEIRNINPATYLGRGKVDELKEKIEELKPEVIVIDAELSPIQSRNLENIWCTRVLDRTAVILDIFALHAKSKEGKLQVELAQYHYLRPRLVRQWTHLSKQRGGGIGLRGPGETQLEVDRRRVRERISLLKKHLKKVSSSREIHREKRNSVPIPTVSLIGYTNTGKSTLFKSLVQENEHIAQDKLFATLDPKTRRLRLPSGQKILLSDTVGFIRNLPHQLIESFKSTFEEVADSDLLLHVIDLSHPNYQQQIDTVEEVLEELELNHIPVLKVYNKMDRVVSLDFHPANSGIDEKVFISALKGLGLDELLIRLEESLSNHYYKKMRLFLPHAKGKELSQLYSCGRVLSTENTPTGYIIEASLPPKWQNVFSEFEVAHDEVFEDLQAAV